MELTALQTLAFSALVVYFGRFLKKKIHFIEKYNLPSPVIGGFVVASVLAILKSYGIFEIKFTKTFEETLMIAFFASIGYSASLKLLKEGGRTVVFFLALTVGGLVLQIIAGIGVAKLMGLPPLMGVLTGAVSLTGGPGTSLAFGPLFETAGIEGASVIGLTTAMGGILLGGLVGTPLATYLINKRRLKAISGSEVETTAEAPMLTARVGSDLLYHFLAMALIMGLGTTLSPWINSLGVTLPIYIGSMIIAAIMRNIEDVKPVFKIKADWIEEIGAVSLTLFIATAIMSLKLDELRNAALPILIFLAVQVVLVAITALGPAFWVAGKDYEGAIISAGYVGFMMGTSANAMANMSSLAQKYGPAPKAFLVVPLVGSCFIDFINAALITFCLNYFG
ncbi:sodium:glutamate symporter [Bdellovibrio bacteriovorus]|uniref:Sodium/glutamate symporter n=1 Tax=Bdellovibrio bacteriovorus TaxID=959 RepID=A0A162GCW7_BDEBC|nr:sodium/glutamate symporter [Bdellovibrio bacteriovorus]KYG67833.1 sodium:glutamate symporter [Bdellovibrio bacteriovorus]